MDIKIVDTTLRDGEQKASIALGVEEKVKIAKMLDSLDIYQIEAGIPAMGGQEKESIHRIMELNLKARISTWNRMNISDIKKSIQCNPHIIHISVPCSDIQIKSKLGKDREWVADNLKRCICFTNEKECEVTIGLEDASRADLGFLIEVLSLAFSEGVKRIRYADTVGVLWRKTIFSEVKKIKNSVNAELEIHTHNDLGMAVSNSVAAVKAGVRYVDCTIGGIGERSGNCDYLKFIKASKGCLNAFEDIDIGKIEQTEKEIMKIMKVPS